MIAAWVAGYHDTAARTQHIRNHDRAAGKVMLAITAVTGAEYSFDGGETWGDAYERAGFDASQTVTFAIRMKETAAHNPSPGRTLISR